MGKKLLLSKLTKAEFKRYQETLGNDGNIGRKFGVTRQAVFQKRKELGVPSLRAKNGKRNERIKSMFNKGKSARFLCEKFDLSISQMYRIINS